MRQACLPVAGGAAGVTGSPWFGGALDLRHQQRQSPSRCLLFILTSFVLTLLPLHYFFVLI